MTANTFVQPDYTSQSGTVYPLAIDAAVAVLARLGASFACHSSSPADLEVQVDAGFVPAIDALAAAVASQATGALTAPVGDPRKDIVHVDRLTGAVGVAAGAENAVPVDPALPAGKIAVARINWTVGMTEITNADLDDLRDFMAGFGRAAALDENAASLSLGAMFYA